MIRVNLHIHSTCSDGVYTPTELVRLLSHNGVAIAALTDHDTASGVPAFLAGCRKRGIRGVAGVEFSSMFTLPNGNEVELHILGYRFDLTNPAINAAFENYCVAREQRNVKVCERLVALGCNVSMGDVRARANFNSNVIGRPHIAQVLVDKGYVPTIRDAFTRYLAEGAPAYVARNLMPSEKVIKLILDAGGLPVWAHPMASLTGDNRNLFTDVLDQLQAFGLKGVECWAHGATSGHIFTCLNEAGRRGLFATAGTDFHGRTGHSAKISGRVVPDDILPWARFCGGR